VAAVFAPDSGEAVMEDAAIKVTVNDHFDIRTKKAILFRKTVVIDLFKSLKMSNFSISPGKFYGFRVTSQ